MLYGLPEYTVTAVPVEQLPQPKRSPRPFTVTARHPIPWPEALLTCSLYFCLPVHIHHFKHNSSG